MSTQKDNPGVRFPPPFIYLGTLLIGIVLERFTGLRSIGIARTILVGVGALLVLAGLVLIAAAIGLFRRKGTTPEPWGTTTLIVTSGPYRFTRNPMYLGLGLVYAGLALALDAPIALILLPLVLVVVQTQVIAREERYLAAKFGESYLEYRRRVRRWL